MQVNGVVERAHHRLARDPVSPLWPLREVAGVDTASASPHRKPGENEDVCRSGRLNLRWPARKGGARHALSSGEGAGSRRRTSATCDSRASYAVGWNMVQPTNAAAAAATSTTMV